MPPSDAWLLLSCSLKWLGLLWCLLVSPGASWCLLVSPGVSWCLPLPDVSEGGAWCLFLLPNFLLVQTRFFFISPWTESPNIAALSAVLGRQCPVRLPAERRVLFLHRDLQAGKMGLLTAAEKNFRMSQSSLKPVSLLRQEGTQA